MLQSHFACCGNAKVDSNGSDLLWSVHRSSLRENMWKRMVKMFLHGSTGSKKKTPSCKQKVRSITFHVLFCFLNRLPPLERIFFFFRLFTKQIRGKNPADLGNAQSVVPS